jgi:hypothetical protein
MGADWQIAFSFRSLPNDGEGHLRELRIMPFLPNNDLAILETSPGGKAASSSLE